MYSEASMGIILENSNENDYTERVGIITACCWN